MPIEQSHSTLKWFHENFEAAKIQYFGFAYEYSPFLGTVRETTISPGRTMFSFQLVQLFLAWQINVNHMFLVAWAPRKETQKRTFYSCNWFRKVFHPGRQPPMVYSFWTGPLSMGIPPTRPHQLHYLVLAENTYLFHFIYWVCHNGLSKRGRWIGKQQQQQKEQNNCDRRW